MVTALNVGNNILVRAFDENIDITPMKLQKMIYFVYRDYLRIAKKALFNERFETWKYGPVVRSVYDQYKKYGANAIKDYAYAPEGKYYYTVNEESSPIFKKVIDSVWGKYKNYDGTYLSAMTHKVGTAWRKAYEAKKPYLSDDDILEEAMSVG